MAADDEVRKWFVTDVLPHEPALMALLRRNWRNAEEIVDLRQETYARMIEAGRSMRPENPRAFMLTIARNLLINRVRRARLVSFEPVDEDKEGMASEQPTQERTALARDELRRVRAAVAKLSPRSQEVFLLRRIEELSIKEIAARIGLSPKTVENHLSRAIRGIADILCEDSPHGGAHEDRNGQSKAGR